jgi:hypothetical protein
MTNQCSLFKKDILEGPIIIYVEYLNIFPNALWSTDVAITQVIFFFRKIVGFCNLFDRFFLKTLGEIIGFWAGFVNN